MKAAEGRLGRVFIIRLEDGDELPGCLERFAEERGVKAGQVVLVGGMGGGEVVVGPRESDAMPPEPMHLPLDAASEVVGAGVLAPDEKGKPVLHLHGSLGRSGSTLTGCFRRGVRTWLVGEVVLYEILDVGAVRRYDEQSRFTLLDPGGDE